MGVLKDTCVFIHNTSTSDKLLEFYFECKSINKELIVTNEILNELKPGRNVLNQQDKDEAHNRYLVVQGAIDKNIIKFRDINMDEQALKNFHDIRRNYYGWMRNPKYLSRLISQGLITREEIESPGFEYKDFGECSLVAIAMLDVEKYIIVTNDKGKVYKHPDINIYENDLVFGVKVMNYSDWKIFVGN